MPHNEAADDEEEIYPGSAFLEQPRKGGDVAKELKFDDVVEEHH